MKLIKNCRKKLVYSVISSAYQRKDIASDFHSNPLQQETLPMAHTVWGLCLFALIVAEAWLSIVRLVALPRPDAGPEDF